MAADRPGGTGLAAIIAVRPTLSIITPSYNQGSFVERTIKSVLDQDYPGLEYIVVDGGSTDETVAILERYSDRIAWWVSEPDGGQTDALNKGLARATGEIVAYINSDDYYLPGSFDAAAAGFETPGVQWLAGRCLYIDDHSGEPPSIWVPEAPRKRRHWWMLEPWGVPQAATFWRRELFQRYGGFRADMHYVFDTEFGLRLAYQGVMPHIVRETLAVRYLHGAAKSADLAPFEREASRFIELFTPALDPWERIQLLTTRGLMRAGWYRLRAQLAMLKRRLTGRPEPTLAVRSILDE